MLNVSVFHIQAVSLLNLRQFDWMSPKDAFIYVRYYKHKALKKMGLEQWFYWSNSRSASVGQDQSNGTLAGIPSA